jgi:ribonucleoside-diphosphate reductase alpha chain
MTSLRQTQEGLRHLHPVDSTKRIIFNRVFTKIGQSPFETVDWECRDVTAGGFSQADVRVPATWTDQSIGIVAKLYFATVNDWREDDVQIMIERVARKLTSEALAHKYFGNPLDDKLIDADGMNAFHDELCYALLHQYVTFNSPVWFNIGVPGRKQVASACFLLSVEDHMLDGGNSIGDWWIKEARIFKDGAGSGINLSNIRGSMEPLSTGGIASGPVAYMRPADAGAGTLKSGGAHRRAAKLVRLDADHPDIRDFIQAKVREDQRMRALAAAGVNMDPSTPEGEKNIAESTSFQNANVSVGVSDEFMKRATTPKNAIAAQNWALSARKTGHSTEFLNASELLHEIAEAAWECADPGIQFDDTINAWHTTPSLGRITTSNPCGETYLNDDSACNLGSLNVLKYVDDKGRFDIKSFRHHVDLMITAMDVTCSFSELPTPAVEANTRNLRQLGLGVSNLGAAVMAQGYAYDSLEGREFAAGMCALMTGRAYARSAHIAEVMGAFKHYEENFSTMHAVIDKHVVHLNELAKSCEPILDPLIMAAGEDWESAQAAEYGFRNSQVTLIQPGGTTSFMMGCDTTGVEPSISLVVYKHLASGGVMKIINGVVRRALYKLGYDDSVVERINHELNADEGRDIEDFIRQEHHAVFATAIGSNTIEPMGHVRMVSAVQPFLSQGVSKTVNMPNDSTVEDIKEVYVESWKRGLKGVSIYRDGSKSTQVLHAKIKQAPAVLEATPTMSDQEFTEMTGLVLPTSVTSFQDLEDRLVDRRRRMPRERDAKVVKFAIDGHEGYLTCGMHPDGTLGEIFFNGIGKDGSTLRGILDAFATDFSIGLQFGVPLETFVRKHAHVSFPPSGPTGDPEVPVAKSIVDYIARKLAALFLDVDTCEELGVMTDAVKARKTAALDAVDDLMEPAKAQKVLDVHQIAYAVSTASAEGKICGECGGSMVRTGVCHTCTSCGNSDGCG